MNGQIRLTIRDEFGNAIGENAAQATSPDNGVTWVFGPGYIPGIETAPVEDVNIDVIPQPQQIYFQNKTYQLNEDGTQQIVVS